MSYVLFLIFSFILRLLICECHLDEYSKNRFYLRIDWRNPVESIEKLQISFYCRRIDLLNRASKSPTLSPMLELVGISKNYNGAAALASTDLSVAEARTTVLIGPSGCGKSTLLRLIAGLILPDSGRIIVEGVPLTPANLMKLRHRMGYVIQEGGLFPHLTVQRNVNLMAQHLGWDGVRIKDRLHELAELVRLPPALLDRFPSELSGGQRQRASLMRALMLDPRLLLLDEPLGALDPMIRYELQQELRAIFEKLGKTVVMVTHDIAEAAFFGHTLVLMRDGRVVQQGSIRELARSPAEPFVEQFITAQRGPMQQLNEALS